MKKPSDGINTDFTLLAMAMIILLWVGYNKLSNLLPNYLFYPYLFVIGILVFLTLAFVISIKSKSGKERKKLKERFQELPFQLLSNSAGGIELGRDCDLNIPICLPDSVRSRHVHVLGSTGSGKTESVILNFLRQDIKRGLGAIILDAKGDLSFLNTLKKWVPKEKLKVFDLSSSESLSYNPLLAGSQSEAAQRLFSSLVWSETYYKSKAFSALQIIFNQHFIQHNTNPRLSDVDHYLSDLEVFNTLQAQDKSTKPWADREFKELSGLRDQVRSLSTDHLSRILSPDGHGKNNSDMNFKDAYDGCVLYFRLQSLLSPQIVSTIGRLVINHLNFLAGTAHKGDDRVGGDAGTIGTSTKILPTYLDEFASFACPEFADLISKARSAGLALHFAHQSIGDLIEVSPGFLSRITDNSATKIIMRINDPDTAEYFARTFGTHIYQKITQRVTNSTESDDAEIIGEGSIRDAHQFRAPPDLFKTLPTGVGSVLIAHGYETPHGASSVFKVKFPALGSA
jgi:hypothetical protein